MNNAVTALVCTILVLVLPSAHASKPLPLGYLTVGAHYSLEKSELEGILGDFGIDSSSTPVLLGGYAGLYITEGVALEVGYNSLGEIESKMTSGQLGSRVSEKLNVKLFGYQAGLAAQGRLGPNAYSDIGVGLGQWYVKTKYSISASGFGSESGSSKEKADDYLYFRFGLGYRLGERWRSSFIFQRNYLELGNFDSDYDQLMFTLSYEFGGIKKRTWAESGRKSLFTYDREDSSPSAANLGEQSERSAATEASAPQPRTQAIEPRSSALDEVESTTPLQPEPVQPEPVQLAPVAPTAPPENVPVDAAVAVEPAPVEPVFDDNRRPTQTAPVNGTPGQSESSDTRCNERNRHLFGILCD